MGNGRTIATMAVAAMVAMSGPAAGGESSPVPVQRVVLYSSGVGYFEHQGTVDGAAKTELQFKTEQINDILKSLVLQDLDGGQVGVVVYPSQDPLAKTLRSFQVDISEDPSLSRLLSQLRGAAVRVKRPAEEDEGIVLGVEVKTRQSEDGETVEEVWWLNLLAEGVIEPIELDSIVHLEIMDSELRAELNKALAAVAGARDQNKKPVTIEFNGTGERRVRLGYVVETPIWKTSYRLILPEEGGDVGQLQGWAIVENQTDSDWNAVDLSLVSGRPISFVQDLYRPLYVPRPVVEPELYASLRPQTYDDGMDRDETPASSPFAGGMAGGRGVVAEEGLRRDRMAKRMAPATVERRLDAEIVAGDAMSYGVAAINATASVSSLASAADMGELFQYTVPGVSLPRQRSAMIPIVTDDVAVERISIYNRQVLAKHPLNGAMVKNTTGKHLLQGPVTVIDAGGYAGDARIEDTPADQSRMLSYAIDLDVLVHADNGQETNAVQTGKVFKGILHVTRKLVRTQKYELQNKSDGEKNIIVEHAFRQGWSLVDSPDPFEKTEQLYRFKNAVAGGKKHELSVTEERVNIERIGILPADIGQIQSFVSTQAIPKDVRDALQKAIGYKGALVSTQRRIEEREQGIRDITGEQDRIRKNMSSVDRRGDYYARLLKKLDDQETQIETLQTEIEELRELKNNQQDQLERYLGDLNVG